MADVMYFTDIYYYYRPLQWWILGRGSPPPPLPPALTYFYTKLRPEGPKKIFGQRPFPPPPPSSPPLISRSESGTALDSKTRTTIKRTRFSQN